MRNKKNENHRWIVKNTTRFTVSVYRVYIAVKFLSSPASVQRLDDIYNIKMTYAYNVSIHCYNILYVLFFTAHSSSPISTLARHIVVVVRIRVLRRDCVKLVWHVCGIYTRGSRCFRTHNYYFFNIMWIAGQVIAILFFDSSSIELKWQIMNRK